MIYNTKQEIITTLLLLIVTTSCAPVTTTITRIEYIQNRTNQTVYVQNVTVKYVNTSKPCTNNISSEPTSQNDYVLGLIKQIKRCENMAYKNYTLNDYRYELEKLNRSFLVCNQTLTEVYGALK
jgi:hypothetical protein